MSSGKKRKRAGRYAPLRNKRLDEELQYGSIRLGRRGNAVYMANDRSAAEQAELDRQMAGMRPKVVAHIQKHVADVRGILQKLDPRQVMNWCYFQAATARLGKMSESDYSHEENVLATHVPEYVQSVIAATQLEPPFQTATNETWDALTAGIMAIYGTKGLHAFFLADTRAHSPRV